jgi:hypothetical protein
MHGARAVDPSTIRLPVFHARPREWACAVGARCASSASGGRRAAARAPDVLNPLADQARDLGRERLERRGRVAGRRRLVAEELRPRDAVPVLLPRLPHAEPPPAHDLQVVPPGVRAYLAPARPLGPWTQAPGGTAWHVRLFRSSAPPGPLGHCSAHIAAPPHEPSAVNPNIYLYHTKSGPGGTLLTDLQVAAAHSLARAAPRTRDCAFPRTLTETCITPTRHAMPACEPVMAHGVGDTLAAPCSVVALGSQGRRPKDPRGGGD